MEQLIESIGERFGDQIDQFFENNSKVATGLMNIGMVYNLCGEFVQRYGARTYVKDSEIWIEDVHVGIDVDVTNNAVAYVLKSPTVNMIVDDLEVLLLTVTHLVPPNIGK